MRRFLTIFALCSASQFSFADVFEGFPDIIVCEVGKPYRPGALTLSVEYQNENKSVYYRSSDGKQFVKLDRKGLVSAASKSTKNSCVGQTLSSLKTKGKTYSYTLIE